MISRIIAIASMAILVTACASNANVGVSQQGYDEYQEYIVTNNSSLAGKVIIGEMNTAMAGDLLRTQVTLINNTRKTRSFEYKFKFYDQSGMEIAADGRPWTPIVIVGNEEKSVQATAPDARATSFKIYVK